MFVHVVSSPFPQIGRLFSFNNDHVLRTTDMLSIFNNKLLFTVFEFLCDDTRTLCSARLVNKTFDEQAGRVLYSRLSVASLGDLTCVHHVLSCEPVSLTSLFPQVSELIKIKVGDSFYGACILRHGAKVQELSFTGRQL